MRVLVVGAGAVGGFLCARLRAAGHDAAVLARGATAAALRAGGLVVRDAAGVETARVEPAALRVYESASAAAAEGARFDATLLCTRAEQVREAAAGLRALGAGCGLVLTLQNGVEAPDEARAALGDQIPLAAGAARMMTRLEGPGVLRDAGVPPAVSLGPYGEAPAGAALEGALTALCGALDDAKVRVERRSKGLEVLWEKLVFVGSFGAVGAIARAPVGAWRAVPETRALYEAALREALAVARADGAALGDEVLRAALESVDKMPFEGASSLQRDLAAGRPSELEAWVGAVLRRARARGMNAPVFGFAYAALLPGERRARTEG